MKMRRTVIIVFVFFWTAGTALCDVASNFGLGANALAMSGAYTGLADDFSACYYNPAGLAYQQRPAFAHDRKGTAAYIGTGIADSRLWVKDPGSSESYQSIPLLSFAQLGLTIGPSALGGILPERRVYFGFALYSPTDVLIGYKMRNSSIDRYFVFYDNENRKFGFLADVAYKFSKYVSIGVGANVLAGADTDTNVNFGQGGFTHNESNVIIIQAAPVAGIMLDFDDLKFGFTYRGEIKFNDYGRVALYASGSQLITESFDWMKFFYPQQYAFGFSYPIVKALLLSADATYINWSAYIDEEGDGRPQTKLFDTVVPRIGVRYSIDDDAGVSAGYAFLRSPVRDQTGTTNFMDSNRHLVSAGGSYTFEKAGFWQNPITLSVYIQDTLFQTRAVHKTQAVDQYQQGYSFGGQVFDAGVQARFVW